MINHLVNQRYEVVEKVGESPLFAVYKARDRVTNQVVAIKSLQPPYATEEGFLAGLNAGLAASANLNHPNITRFLEAGVDEDVPYAITEFVRGINLKERIRRIAPFTLSVAVDFACAITEALHYAHKLGQVHGDLRPQNIIVSPEGALKVTDFGIQRAVARSAGAQSATLLRAASYHAPELSTTQPGTVAGDIYALGSILYEMLTGAPLYAGDTPEAIADLHAFAPIPSPRLIIPGVPRSVEGIVLKCLQKRPDQRYHNTVDLLNDLKAVRDALRFGKPLSWSPIDTDNLTGETAIPVAAGTPSSRPGEQPVTRRVQEPIAEVTASTQTIPMPAKSRLRTENERISFVLRLLIAIMTSAIVLCLFGIMYVWATRWVVPKPIDVPQMIGKPIEEVRQIAARMKVRLIENAEYTDQPRNIVYKTEPKMGAQTRPNHILNVWYSRGPFYVDVPNLVNMSREDAEQKLKDVGLVVGKIVPEFSDTVPANNVIRQTVSYKKRVYHDTAVDLVVSDGPKPDYSMENKAADSAVPNGTTTPDASATEPNSGVNTAPTPDPAQVEETHTFDRKISIPHDHKGSRQVRITYKDSLGASITVVDEPHGEGEEIPVSFTYSGKNITLSIYYDDKPVWTKTFDPLATKDQTVR